MRPTIVTGATTLPDRVAGESGAADTSPRNIVGNPTSLVRRVKQYGAGLTQFVMWDT